MLYLAVDQHRKQLTVNCRNEAGDVILKRQVSTEWARVPAFLAEVRERSVSEGGVVAGCHVRRVRRHVGYPLQDATSLTAFFDLRGTHEPHWSHNVPTASMGTAPGTAARAGRWVAPPSSNALKVWSAASSDH